MPARDADAHLHTIGIATRSRHRQRERERETERVGHGDRDKDRARQTNRAPSTACEVESALYGSKTTKGGGTIEVPAPDHVGSYA